MREGQVTAAKNRHNQGEVPHAIIAGGFAKQLFGFQLLYKTNDNNFKKLIDDKVLGFLLMEANQAGAAWFPHKLDTSG